MGQIPDNEESINQIKHGEIAIEITSHLEAQKVTNRSREEMEFSRNL